MRCRTQHPAAAASAAVPAAAFLRFHFAVDSGLCTADAAGSVGNDVVGGGAQRQPGRFRLQATRQEPVQRRADGRILSCLGLTSQGHKIFHAKCNDIVYNESYNTLYNNSR